MKTLYSKYILFTIVMFILSIVFSLLITNAIYHQVMKKQNDENYVSLATEITNYLETERPEDLTAYFTHLGDIGYQIYLVDETGEEQFFGGEFRLKEIPEDKVTEVLQGKMYHGIREYPRKLFITGFFSNDLQNSVGRNFTYEDKAYAMFIRLNIKMLFSEMHFIIGGLFVFILIVNIFASVFVTRYLLKPIKQLSNATAKIASENFDLQVDIHRADELGRLAHNFNEMTTELKHQRDARKAFIQNASHDFQTPLQNISGYANLIQQDTQASPEVVEYSKVIQQESEKLSQLTKQLLLWQHATRFAETKSAIRLDQLIRQVVQDHQYLVQRKEITIWLELQEVTMRGSETFLTHLVENLLTNALKYSSQAGEITITCHKSNEQIELSFVDNGIGMTAEELNHVFTPFYRADEARHTDGTGLGLVIVKQVVEMHDGKIIIQSEVNKGTTFKICFPLN